MNVFFKRKYLRKKLRQWYHLHKRDLPWRKTLDPYKIWTSEIMLQQTQVATVIPYYQKWVKTFPKLETFAKAPLSKVLKLWAGLGYYRRARMFHKAAQYVKKNLGGKIPGKMEELRKLPGIGRYTAGAIASIAYNETVPVLDGNVIRILTRIFGISQNIDRPATIGKLWKIAETLLPKKNPGDFNQALMELGATLCFSLNPECSRCPVRTSCIAHKKRREIFYPVRSKREKYEKILMTALVVQNKKLEVFIEKQPEQGRWGGLWMFPFWTRKEDMLRASSKICCQLRHFLTLQHAFTKYRIRLEVYRGDFKKKGIQRRRNWRWISIRTLKDLAIPSPHRKIAEKLSLENSLESGLFSPKKTASVNNF